MIACLAVGIFADVRHLQHLMACLQSGEQT
jgi:hypothetical protein